MGDDAMQMQTRTIPVDAVHLGQFTDRNSLETWELADQSQLAPLLEAASHLKSSNIPVAFPTETVYGLGADATRSNAVQGISIAKGRPPDNHNPFIIHVCDLTMLRSLLAPAEGNEVPIPIPAIYRPLIKAFWPGPLTILLPNPSPSKLAPEVTAGLPSFGARMPDSSLALSLIQLAGVPLAAPSANASTKPSSTMAQHVLHDLAGRIEIILDGGPCEVGVESTVVDGLCSPPVILRPGGIGIHQIRSCEGWHNVMKGYTDASEREISIQAPCASGMKYKHYSPKATVILYEVLPPSIPSIHLPSREILEHLSMLPGAFSPDMIRDRIPTQRILKHLSVLPSNPLPRIGIITTKKWPQWAGLHLSRHPDSRVLTIAGATMVQTSNAFTVRQAELRDAKGALAEVVEVTLGKETKAIAHGLFSALRELDEQRVDVIHVEGIDDAAVSGVDIASAVMNRLRKAASIIEE